MQKRVVGLPSIPDLVEGKARWPMNLLPMRYIICRMRKAIGLLIFILFKNSADPHGQDLKPHGLSFFRCHFPSMMIPTITNP